MDELGNYTERSASFFSPHLRKPRTIRPTSGASTSPMCAIRTPGRRRIDKAGRFPSGRDPAAPGASPMPTLCRRTGARGLPRPRHRRGFRIHEHAATSGAGPGHFSTAALSRLPTQAAAPASRPVRRRPAVSPRSGGGWWRSSPAVSDSSITWIETAGNTNPAFSIWGDLARSRAQAVIRVRSGAPELVRGYQQKHTPSTRRTTLVVITDWGVALWGVVIVAVFVVDLVDTGASDGALEALEWLEARSQRCS